MKKNKKHHYINEEIRHTRVNLLGHGIMNIVDALSKASESELDLVLVNENSQVPVCKLMKYEKYLYELDKKQNNKTLELKEIKIGPNTSENDLSYRIKHINEFLTKGHRIKLSMQFKGREISFIDKGKALMLKLILAVEEYGLPESLPNLEGKKMFCIIRPFVNKVKKLNT